jgi:hypothetical protein
VSATGRVWPGAVRPGAAWPPARRRGPRRSLSGCLPSSTSRPAVRRSPDASAAGIRKLYEPSPVLTLYVGRVEDFFGRVPLFPCLLEGNAISTILYEYAARQKKAFGFGCVDARWSRPGITQGQPTTTTQ